ncbi:hypothetical protein GNF83_18225 [Clostridium perfringens]|uniref:Uncharacterized protein n=1 Tax=Clostridium perfringens TaxID=1502 RepID=A0AAW9K8Z4_CLOPF|nr:hypothetical protein [Clostridium perfringens]
MNIKQANALKFYQAVGYLEDCSDTIIKNSQGDILEVGYMITSESEFITYNYEEKLIKFYVDDKVVFSFDKESPIIVMFESLLISMNEK